MMRVVTCILIAMGLSISIASAQVPEYTCTDLTHAMDLTTSCKTLMTCQDTDEVCMQEGVATLLDACSQARLSDCATRTVLYWIVNHHIRMDGLYLFHPDGFEPSLLATVSAFDSGDYETAILEFEDITQSDDYAPYFTLEIAHGILYYANGDYEQAFTHFDKSINAMPEFSRNMLSEFDNPIAYYFRGQIYRQWGDEDRALQDFYTYDALATDRLKTRLPLSSFRLTLNNVQRQVMYPVFNGFTHLYGFGYADLTRTEPTQFELSYRNDRDTLVVTGLFQRQNDVTLDILFLQRDPDNPSDYYLNFNVPDIHAKPDTYHLKITVHPTHLNYYETLWHLEGSATRVGIILPPIEPDIRLNSTQRLCDNSSISFVQIGDVLDIVNFNGEIDVIDDPTVEDVVATVNNDDIDARLTVQDGYVCLDDLIWWQVSNGEITGWVSENNTWTDNFFSDDTASVYRVMPEDVVESWRVDNPSGLIAGIPTPLEFLGVTIERE